MKKKTEISVKYRQKNIQKIKKKIFNSMSSYLFFK